MRLLLFLLYYGIAFLMGFVIRARFDAWMYAKPYMQQRLVVWADDAVTYVEQGGADTLLPPETTDAEAFSPVFRRTRLGRVLRRPVPSDGDAVPEGMDSPPGRLAGSAGTPPPVDPA